MTFNNTKTPSCVLKERGDYGGPRRALNASHYFDDLFRSAKHAPSHPALPIGLVKHSSGPMHACTHASYTEPCNHVSIPRCRFVIATVIPRFSLCRSAAINRFSQLRPSISHSLYVYKYIYVYVYSSRSVASALCPKRVYARGQREGEERRKLIMQKRERWKKRGGG